MEFVPKISEPPAPGSARLIKKEPRLEVGARIFNRFILQAELGKGRCSTSWLVEDPRFRREVVLKLFRSQGEEGTDEERLIWRDFLRRLRILNHPDIVITIEYFHEGSWLALSSNYENGPTLAALSLQVGRKLTFPQIQDILRTVGSAVAAAHDKCLIVHGNLNAYNILVPVRRAAAKITDFGFHPPTPPKTNDAPISLELAWKIACQSPERLKGGTPSHADDIYAFAVVAFQLLTGKNPPLDSDGNVNMTDAGLLLAEIPQKWREQMLIALSPEPSDRPEVLSMMLQEMEIFVEFNPLLQEWEKTEQQVTAERKRIRPRKMPGREKPTQKLLLRILTVFCAIVMPAALGWLLYRNHTVDLQLRTQRVQDEKHEKALEAEESDHIFQLNDRIGGDFAPTRANLDLYRQTLNAPVSTPKPTPLVINSGANDFYKEGRVKLSAGDAAGAMESFELAIVLQPDWPDLLEARGQALLALNRVGDAALEFSKALIVEPARVGSLIGRAKAHIAVKENKDAAADLQNALKLDPENAEAKDLVEKNSISLHTEPGVIQ